MIRKLLFLYFVTLSIGLNAQQQIKGLVKDKFTNAPLAFVTVAAKSGDRLYGATTDIDGRFFLNVGQKPDSIRFSYVGYFPKTIPFLGEPNLVVTLNKQTFGLKEVTVLPGINPADLIMEKVITNRKVNNPELNTKFKYNTYNKFKVSTNKPPGLSDDDEDTLDSLAKADEFSKYDSITDFFIMESVSERIHMPPSKSYEKVIANRVSGLKNPTFALLATQFQSFTIYSDYIKLLDNNFLSPTAIGSTNKYLFIIEDTVPITGKDTTFILSFRPKRGKNFTGLKGLLYINSNRYAVENVYAEPAESLSSGFDLLIQQRYQYIDGKQWFPVQLNTDFIFGQTSKDLQEIRKSYDYDENGNPISPADSSAVNISMGDSGSNIFPIASGRTYIRDIDLIPEIEKRDFSYVAVEIDPKASNASEAFWESQRQEGITKNELLSYNLLDSIGDEVKFDEKLKWFTALTSGRFPYKFIDIDLRQIIRFNNYEGFRLGAGLYTNDQISRYFSVGGYFAYGFSDKQNKYGASTEFFLNKRKSTTLKYEYVKDVVETGALPLPFKEPFINTTSIRNFYLNRMDLYDKHQLSFKFRSLGYLQSEIYGKSEFRTITHDYNFATRAADNVFLLSNQFRFYETGWYFRYAHNEKIVRSELIDIPIQTKYPIIKGLISRGFIYDNNGLDYWRYEVQLDKKFLLRNKGETHIKLQAGGVEGEVPYFLWGNTPGTFDQRVRSGVYVMSNTGFETMFLNEFFNEQYAYVFVKHNFKSLLFKGKKFRPQFALAFNYGIGTARSQAVDNQRNVNFSTLDNGFMESGLIINNLINNQFSGLGVSIFYRHGPNAFEKTSDNLFFKLTSIIVF